MNGYLFRLDVPNARDDDAGVSVSAQSACNRKRNLYFNWAQLALCNILLDFQTPEMMIRFLLRTLPLLETSQILLLPRLRVTTAKGANAACLVIQLLFCTVCGICCSPLFF